MENLITFDAEKLNNVHPRIVLALAEEMVKNELASGYIRDVEQVEVDARNSYTSIIFTAVPDALVTGLKTGSNLTRWYQLSVRHANNFSCAQIVLKTL